MLLACLVLGFMACHDDPAGPGRQRPLPTAAAPGATGPVTLLRASCELRFAGAADSAGTVSCGGPSGGGMVGGRPRAAPGVSASVIQQGPAGPYALFWPYNMVKDSVAETWEFRADFKNLLAQPLGTLDGSTPLGTRIVITGGPWVTGGTGTVTVANADGTGSFAGGADEPYFFYGGIVAPGQWSVAKSWRFNVPRTVTDVAISIAIVTDFPAERDVAITPPDSVPAWINADTSAVGPTNAIGHQFTKNVAIVIFSDSSSLADRQLAVALVGGKVIGGDPYSPTTGVYLLWIPDDGTGAQLRDAIKRLQALPQVQVAMPRIYLEEMHLKPDDGGNWARNRWRLNPDSADLGSQRWAFEQVDAPMAWGCSTGDATTVVGIVDHGFHNQNVPDLQRNLPDSSYATNPADTGQHGTHVASVLAAEGNNGVGMTGMMWREAKEWRNAPRMRATESASVPSRSKRSARGRGRGMGELYETTRDAARIPRRECWW